MTISQQVCAMAVFGMVVARPALAKLDPCVRGDRAHCVVATLLPTTLRTDPEAMQRADAELDDLALALANLPNPVVAAVAREAKLLAKESAAQAGGAAAWTALLAERGQTQLGWTVVTQTVLAVNRRLAVQAVPETRVRERFDKRWGRFVTPEQVQLREIAVPMASSATPDVAVAQSAMIAAKERLDRGESFTTIARVVSRAPTRTQGGERGWCSVDALDPALQHAIAMLQPGEASPIVGSAWGLHILQLVARKPAHKLNFAEAKLRIEAQLRREEQALARRTWLVRAREAAGRATQQDNQ